jgi:hypothetical protein
MPTVREEAEIDVRAPALFAFGIVAGDLMLVNDDPDAVAGHRPVDPGPLRSGFRWQQTLAHERRVCRTDWTITALHEARLLEQSFTHLCTVSGRVLDGGERWEFVEAEDGSTVVKLTAWRERPGLDGWLERIFGCRAWGVSLRNRLNNVQFRAERRAARV